MRTRVHHRARRWEYRIERRLPGTWGSSQDLDEFLQGLLSEARRDERLLLALVELCENISRRDLTRALRRRTLPPSERLTFVERTLRSANALPLKMERRPIAPPAPPPRSQDIWRNTKPVSTRPPPERVAAWFALKIVDQDGEPVPRRGFHVRGAAGDDHEGFVDGTGRAHVALAEEGPVRLRLPDLSPEDLRRAEAIAGRRVIDTGPVRSSVGDGTIHVVERGETLISLAARYHALHWVPIWNDASNAALRQARDDAQCLVPGDEVCIPRRIPIEVRASAFDEHVVRVFRSKPEVHLRVRDAWREPLETEPSALGGEGVESPHREGELLVARVSPETREVTLTLSGRELRIEVGALPPVGERAGVVARLRNLGYDPGDEDDPSDEALTLAIEELQHDYGQKVTGSRQGAFSETLRKVHGQ